MRGARTGGVGWALLVAAAVSGSACGEPEKAGATVTGTLTLPGAAPGKPYFVRVYPTPSSDFVAEARATTGGGTTLSYVTKGVPAGTYHILGFVDVDGSGGVASTAGDFRGWYGHGGDGNPPTEPGAVVPAMGTVSFDFVLVVAP